MPCLRLRLPKKVHQLPSKAWQSFTFSLHHHHLKFPKSVTTTARRLLRLRPKRRQFGQRPPRGGARKQYQHLRQSAPNSPASTVYVDRLFGESPPSSQPSTVEATEADDGGRKNASVRLKEYVSSLPRIRGIDERAEEFISKFRQQMQIQREQSILDFQDMLARTA